MDLFDYHLKQTPIKAKPELAMRPRDYQQLAIDNAFAMFAQGISGVIARSPTGTGKTKIGAFAADRWLRQGDNYRVLILAHERQLIQQFAEEIRETLGNRYTMAIEMSDQHCTGREDIIVASRQTLLVREDKDEYGNDTTTSRLYKFDPNINWLVIPDEAHRWALKLKSCKFIVEHFEQNPNSKRMGLTATPLRGDGTSLEKLFPGIALDYRMFDPSGGPCALSDGWCVPYDQRFVTVDGVDFKNLREVAKDFDAGHLEEVLGEQETLAKLVKPMMDIVENRQTIIFNPGTEMARKVALYINAKLGKDAAYSVDGSFPDDARREIYRQFEKCEFQFLSVCGLCREGFNCLDDETEVLTEDGWKAWNQFSDIEFLYSLNRSSGAMELVPMTQYLRRPAREDERFVTMRSQHFNVRVTEGHEFHVKKYDARRTPRISDEYTTFEAGQFVGIKGEYSFPLSAESKFPGIELTDDEIKFIAWFMTDGCGAGLRSDVSISQSDANRDKQDRIREIIHRCGFDHTESKRPNHGYANGKPLLTLRVPKGNHRGSMKRNGWEKLAPYLTKEVSPLLHNMTREQFWLFWQELLLGDGSVMEGKSGWLLCDRMSQVNAYTQMAVTRGFATSYAERITDSGKLVWRVSVRDKKFITSRFSDARGTKVGFESPSSGENVWCVSNRNSTIVTRRGGKVSIVGNCRPIGAVAIFRPTKSVSLSEQMRGRGCRPLAGLVDDTMTPEERRAAIAASDKPNCVIVDLVGVTGLGDCASTAHIFAQGKPDEVIERANDNMRGKEGACNVIDELRKAEEEIEAEKEEKRRIEILKAEEREAARLEREERKKREQEEMLKRSRLKAEVKYQQRQVQSGHGAVMPGEKKSTATMPFGKHKGSLVADLSTGYLKAFAEKMDRAPQWLLGAIKKELTKRDVKVTRQTETPPQVSVTHRPSAPHHAGVWEDALALLRD